MKSHTANTVMGSMHATIAAVRSGRKVERKTRKPAVNITVSMWKSQQTTPTPDDTSLYTQAPVPYLKIHRPRTLARLKRRRSFSVRLARRSYAAGGGRARLRYVSTAAVGFAAVESARLRRTVWQSIGTGSWPHLTSSLENVYFCMQECSACGQPLLGTQELA